MKKLKTMWCIMLGPGHRLATQKLYSYAKARKLAARAKARGIDVYAVRFGKVRL